MQKEFHCLSKSERDNDNEADGFEYIVAIKRQIQTFLDKLFCSSDHFLGLDAYLWPRTVHSSVHIGLARQCEGYCKPLEHEALGVVPHG